jgi:hypothetical protein
MPPCFPFSTRRRPGENVRRCRNIIGVPSLRGKPWSWRRGRVPRWTAWVLSAALHAVLVGVILRAGPSGLPRSAEDVLEIELRPAPAPVLPEPAAPASAEVPPAPRSREGHPRPPPGGAGARRAPTAAPLVGAQPAAREPVRSRFWLRMRSPVEAMPLVRAPAGEAAPSGPPRDELGLPYNPPPDVIHHPIGEQVQGNTRTGTGVAVRVDSEGGIRFRDPPIPDLNTVAERIAGNDPFSFEKARIAAATFEERLCLAKEAARRRLQDGAFHLKERLDHLRELPGLSTAQRREIAFEMWDECLEDRSDGPDLYAAARATIVAFIRRAFPPGSPDAYTSAELATLNRRRVSRAPFDPYATADAGAP